MAYNADNAPDLEGTLYRDGEWFRENASKSGTPVTQFAKTVLVPDRIGRNAPLRRQPSEVDHLLDAAAATMRALLLAPGSMPAQPRGPLPPMERVAKTGMHGGAQIGERFSPPKLRQQRLASNPAPDMTRAKVGTKVEVKRVFTPSSFHTVASRAVERGVAEVEALAAVRRAADAHRGA
jgi:hypothetical protein